jgi:hypothetical protein
MHATNWPLPPGESVLLRICFGLACFNVLGSFSSSPRSLSAGFFILLEVFGKYFYSGRGALCCFLKPEIEDFVFLLSWKN